MKFSRYLYSVTVALVFLFAMHINSSAKAEEAQDEAPINKNKKEILSDIDLFEQGLHKTKSCVSEARTAADLEKCRDKETASRFQKIQDSLSEIGMTREERRLYELRPQK